MRIVVTLLLVLLGATLPGEATAQVCPTACCCPADAPGDADCAALAGSCCHAAGAPGVPSGAATSTPAPTGAAAPDHSFAGLVAPVRYAAVLPFTEDARRPAALRLSVVLRI